MSNGSGDYIIAFSTAQEVRRTPERRSRIYAYPEMPNDLMSPLFQAAIEATEEAIYNAHGHKLRFPTFEKPQFMTALGIIRCAWQRQ